jgi:hypothetical protein
LFRAFLFLSLARSRAQSSPINGVKQGPLTAFGQKGERQGVRLFTPFVQNADAAVATARF